MWSVEISSYDTERPITCALRVMISKEQLENLKLPKHPGYPFRKKGKSLEQANAEYGWNSAKFISDQKICSFNLG